MFPFQQNQTPAVQDHLRSQFSIFTDMSQKMFDTAQKINELNIQVAKTVMEESIQTTQQVLSAQNPMEAITVCSGQVQPVAEKLRSYQQHLSNIAAGAQVDLSKTMESRIPEATRTATAVAEEVTRQASEQTQKATERQRAVMEKMTKSASDLANISKGTSPASGKGVAPGAQPGTH